MERMSEQHSSSGHGHGHGGGGEVQGERTKGEAQTLFSEGLRDLLTPCITKIDKHVQDTQETQETLRAALDTLHERVYRGRCKRECV